MVPVKVNPHSASNASSDCPMHAIKPELFLHVEAPLISWPDSDVGG